MMNQSNCFVTDWSAYPPLPEDADQLIANKVNEQRGNLRQSNFGDVSESVGVVQYRGGTQTFAVMGSTAYELLNLITNEPDEKHFAFRPALLKGVAYRSEPDEGRSGTLHWMWSERFPEWSLTWLSAGGWIYTKELDQSPHEIMDNMAEEVEAGKTPFTGNNSKPEYQ